MTTATVPMVSVGEIDDGKNELLTKITCLRGANKWIHVISILKMNDDEETARKRMLLLKLCILHHLSGKEGISTGTRK